MTRVKDGDVDRVVEEIATAALTWPEPSENVVEVRVTADREIRRLLGTAGITLEDDR